MILIDTNVFMYAAGAEHAGKQPSCTFLEQVAAGNVEAAVDTETLQEILHRYRSIRRWEDGRRVYDLARRIVPNVVPVTPDVLDAARRLMDDIPDLSARDAVHAAVYRLIGATALVSYDADFDRIPGVRRRRP